MMIMNSVAFPLTAAGLILHSLAYKYGSVYFAFGGKIAFFLCWGSELG